MNRTPVSVARRVLVFLLLLVASASAILAQDSPTGSPNLNRTLILVELAGGNDGLNMVVPYADPLYYADRPTLAVSKDEVLRLDGKLGLNPAMRALMDSWNAKELAFVLGVGYPNPDRSHFRSIAIWNTASGSDRHLTTGWIAKLFSATAPPASELADSIIIGEDHAGPLYGPRMKNLAIDSIKGFVTLAALAGDPGSELKGGVTQVDNGALSYIRGVESDVRTAAATLRKIASNAPKLKTSFPDTQFGRQLELAAQLLGAGVQVPVIKLTLRGFDTHGGERPIQDRLLGELSDALASFRLAMIEENRWDATAVVTYSEFGRRVAENGSEGTDHGTAAPMLVMGGMVKGGLYGKEPDLSDLDHGDLKFTVDYRSVYQAIMSQFWGIRDDRVLSSVLVGTYPDLPIFSPPQ